jgi:hypothetical protein
MRKEIIDLFKVITSSGKDKQNEGLLILALLLEKNDGIKADKYFYAENLPEVFDKIALSEEDILEIIKKSETVYTKISPSPTLIWAIGKSLRRESFLFQLKILKEITQPNEEVWQVIVAIENTLDFVKKDEIVGLTNKLEEIKQMDGISVQIKDSIIRILKEMHP